MSAPVRDTGAGAVLATVSLATFVALMNYTAPMLTLPGMTASFGTGVSGQAWLLNGIALGLAALLLVAGSLADDYGRKRVFVAGTAVLAVTVALGAAASSTLTFTLARIAQGGASAAIVASSLGLLAQAYPQGPARVRAMGVWGAALSGGIATGPVASAALGALDWRVGYALYAVAALVLAAVSARTLTESRSPRPGRPDLLGAVVLGLALTALLAALTVGRDGWLRPAVGELLGATAVLLAAFVAIERRVSAPMLDLGLFRRPAFLAATSSALFTGLGVIGMFSYFPALLQQAMGMSELGTAWLLCLWSGVALLVALQAKRLPERFSARHQLALGFVLSALGALTMLGAMSSGSWVRTLPGWLVAGVGSGLLNAAMPRAAVESVPPDRASMGSGANNTARYIGSSMGLSLTIVVATSAGSGHGGDSARALAHGADHALLVGVALMLAGAVGALAFRERRTARTRAVAVR
ncbi:MFS transporter [Streptomyces sp. NPDC048172]|uniref:MFS transporter n=1 Tax=Streptomyces sp. NPDC048172 TaxID=3365505 RepID=UPI0037237A3C